MCFSSAADINLNSPNKGLLADAMTDVPVDSSAAARTAAPEGLTAAEEEELRAEIAKVGRASAVSCWGGKSKNLGCHRSRARGFYFASDGSVTCASPRALLKSTKLADTSNGA